MSVKIPATRVKKSQQAPPAVSPVTTIFYPGDWNFLRTHLASSFIILITCIRLAIVPLVQNSLMTFMRTQVSHHYQLRGFDTIEKLMTILMTLSNRQWRTRGLVSTSLQAARCDIHVCCINKVYVYIIG